MSTTQSTQAGSLFKKLSAVMADVGYIQKDGFNSFHKYKYVTEAALVDAVRTKLAAANVMLIPSVVGVDERQITTKKGDHSTVSTLRMEFTFCDGDTGETFTVQWAGAGDDAADKGIYKAYTGALKYFLMKTFLIPTGDDPESDTASDECGSDRAPAVFTMPGQRPMPPDQLAAIQAAFVAAGRPADDLAGWLDRTDAPQNDDLGARILSIGATKGVELQRWFAERAKEPVAA